MKNKKIAAIFGVAALALTACGGNKGTDSSAGSDSAKSVDYKACLVSDEGGWDDKSFNESAMVGLDRAVKELGVKKGAAESNSEDVFVTNVENMVSDNCNLIIGVGFKLKAAVSTSAGANADISYALVDSDFAEKHDNGRPLVFNTHEAAYLAGYAAAAKSTTGVVGTFGGMQIPSVSIFMDGFVDGVARYNADKGTNVKVLGWDKETQQGLFTGDFSDKTKGSRTADQLMQQGADVIMPVAGPVGLGAASAVKANGKAVIIGVDSDWYESASEYKDIVFTSVKKDIGNAVYDTIKSGLEKKFDSSPYVGTLANEGVALAPFHDFESSLPSGLADELEALKKEIVEGKTVVSSQVAFAVK